MQSEKEGGGIFRNSVEQKKCEESNCGCWTTVKSKKKNRMTRVNKWKQFDMNALGMIPEGNEKEVELNVVEKGNVQWEIHEQYCLCFNPGFGISQTQSLHPQCNFLDWSRLEQREIRGHLPGQFSI